jgi:hypothetical protein
MRLAGRFHPTYLYSGGRLLIAEEWAGSHPSELSPDEAEFLRCGREAQQRREAAELEAARKLVEEQRERAELSEQREKEQKVAARRLRHRAWVAAGLGVAALIFGVTALIFGVRSESYRVLAEQRAGRAVKKAQIAEEAVQDQRKTIDRLTSEILLLSKRVGGGIIYDEHSKLGVTSDGPGGSNAEDPTYQRETSLKHADGRSVNSRIVPYIAIPKINLASDKVKAGDNLIVFNTSNGRQAFAVIGDIAPNKNAIYLSVALANSLGIHFDLKKGEVGTDKIICLVFPASGSGYCPESPAAIDEQGRTLFKAWLVSLR